jgi:hypothetical protein
MVYLSGNHFVICDRCGFKKLRTECRKEWTGLLVCSDTCWEPKHPQLTIKGKKDMQAVRDARPEADDIYLSTVYASRVKAEDL